MIIIEERVFYFESFAGNVFILFWGGCYRNIGGVFKEGCSIFGLFLGIEIVDDDFKGVSWRGVSKMGFFNRY